MKKWTSKSKKSDKASDPEVIMPNPHGMDDDTMCGAWILNQLCSEDPKYKGTHFYTELVEQVMQTPELMQAAPIANDPALTVKGAPAQEGELQTPLPRSYAEPIVGRALIKMGKANRLESLQRLSSALLYSIAVHHVAREIELASKNGLGEYEKDYVPPGGWQR